MKEFRDKNGRFTDIPDCVAHPVLIDRMMREVEEGNAETAAVALECVKKKLKALNSSVTVDLEEYEEILQIKPMLLIRKTLKSGNSEFLQQEYDHLSVSSFHGVIQEFLDCYMGIVCIFDE